MPQLGSSLARVAPARLFPVMLALLGLLGMMPARAAAGPLAAGPAHPATYTCPMHPDVTSPKPGTCPRCHMTLVAKGGAPEGAYTLDLDATPRAPGAGQPLRLRLTVRDRATGGVVRDFAVVHEKRYHLFVVSRDLEHFDHLHPQQADDGSWVVDVTLPEGGAYTIYSDFLPAGGTPQVLDVPLDAGAARSHPSPAHLVPDRAFTKTIAGLSVALELPEGGLVAGRPEPLTYRLTDARTGAPVRDLEPYLGAWGHTVILSEDSTHFVHAHPAELAPAGGGAGGPVLTFETRFPESGVYRVWTQIQRRGEIVTTTFTLAVASSAAADE